MKTLAASPPGPTPSTSTECREHYHRRSAELYYVLEGEGQVLLDGQTHAVRKGSIVHIPPGVIHGARGRMRVLVVGVPDIADDDLYFPEDDA